MSSSHYLPSEAAAAAASSATSSPVSSATSRSQLDYDQIIELLTQGLVNFIACFAEESPLVEKFKERFAANFLRSPIDKKNFNQFGSVMIKAGYPTIFMLSAIENDYLRRLGILHQQRTAEDLINQFFKKDDLVQFILDNVKEKYSSECINLVDIIYKFLVAATCTLYYESYLGNIDKNNRIISDKNTQVAIFSGIDLQLATATNNLKLVSDKLLKLKSKTTKTNEITQSLAKIRSGFSIAAAEYAKNLSEKKSEILKQQKQDVTELANKTQSELSSTQHTLKSAQEQLEEERKKVQALTELAEARWKEKLLAEQQLEEERIRAKALLEQFDRFDVEPGSASSSNAIEEATERSAAASSTDNNNCEVEKLRKQVEFLQKQQELKDNALAITEAAKNVKQNDKQATLAFNHLINQSCQPNITAETHLNNLILWLKSALSYLINKPVSKTSTVAKALPTYLVSTLSFIGKTTGIGTMKTTSQEKNSALKKELIEVLQQCILISEQHRNFNESVQMLNQHLRNLAFNHGAEALSESTVSNQLIQITNKLTYVAKEFFNLNSAVKIM